MDVKILYSIISAMVVMIGYFYIRDRNSIDKEFKRLIDVIERFTSEIKQSNDDYKKENSKSIRANNNHIAILYDKEIAINTRIDNIKYKNKLKE